MVRVDLKAMSNETTCILHYWMEHYNAHGNIVVNSTVSDPDLACVMVIDLASKYPFAKGFRRGFVGYPYGYLSAGHFSTVARIDIENFGLETTKLIDLSVVDQTYGGYAGGFSDGSWACFRYICNYLLSVSVATLVNCICLFIL